MVVFNKNCYSTIPFKMCKNRLGSPLTIDVFDTMPTQIILPELSWPITVTDDKIRVGCEMHTMEEWERMIEVKSSAVINRVSIETARKILKAVKSLKG